MFYVLKGVRFYLEGSSPTSAERRGMVVAMAEASETIWTELPIGCPHCSNHGDEGGAWQTNGWTPFRLVEEVVRSWIFEAKGDSSGALLLTADASNDKVDWESGTNLRLECGQCFETFPLPPQTKVEFA